MRRVNRTAVTLIEVLVVIAIIGVLVGLTVPAVMRARESANYLKCRTQLKQLALAVHNYEVAFGYFPGIGVAPRQESVLYKLLPFLEQEPLYRSVATVDGHLFTPVGEFSVLNPAHAEAARTVIPSFLCPSDAHPPKYDAYDYAELAGGNYVANTGTGTGTNYDLRFPTDGAFWFGSQLRPKDVADGLSSTMLFSEALLGAGVDDSSPTLPDATRYWMAASCQVTLMPFQAGTFPPLTDTVCRAQIPGMIWRGDRGVSWIGGPGHRGAFNTYAMPNDKMHDCGAYGVGWFKASSGHVGGVNMILGDGSVHFIKDHIELHTWRALSTRNQGEAIGSYCGCK